MSATTMRAPSSPNKTDASRPMPMPAPVISATLPFRRSATASPLCRVGCAPASDPLEVPQQLPVGHGLIEGLLLEAGRVQVVIDHAVTERRPRDLRALQLADG